MRTTVALARLPIHALAAVLVVTGGMALASPASAAVTLPVPTTFGTSPAPLSGSASDPCGFSKPYGYIGDDDITFSAVIDAPSDAPASAEFRIVPSDGSAPLDFVTGPT